MEEAQAELRRAKSSRSFASVLTRKPKLKSASRRSSNVSFQIVSGFDLIPSHSHGYNHLFIFFLIDLPIVTLFVALEAQSNAELSSLRKKAEQLEAERKSLIQRHHEESEKLQQQIKVLSNLIGL